MMTAVYSSRSCRRSRVSVALAAVMVACGLSASAGRAQTAAQTAAQLPAAAPAAAPATELSRFFPVREGLDTNPYARAAMQRVAAALRVKVDPAAPGEVLRVMPKFTDVRAFADETQLLVWAYLVPGSPHAGKAELLDAILKRMELLSRTAEKGSYIGLYPSVDDNHYNVFLFESWSFAYLALKTVSPAAIPPESQARWEKVLRAGLTYQAEAPEGHERDGEYGIIPNIDLRYAVMLEVGARLFNDPALSAKGERLLDVAAKYLMPDGAFLYYGGENQSFSYQESCLRDLARYHFLTRGEARGGRSAELIVASRNYYPLSMEPGGVAEYATAPNWKAFWNGSGMVAGPEIVAHFSGDPVNRGIAREQLRRTPDARTVYLSDLLITAGTFDPTGPTAPQVDGQLMPDTNVGGFRGRFGRFSFVADARDRRKTISALPPTSADNDRDFLGTHLGKATYVGALVTDADARFQPFNAALLRVNSAVTTDASKPFWRGSAYLSHKSSDFVSYSADRGGLSAQYELGTSTFGPKFVPVPGWKGREAWVFAKDRMVGYVELEAAADNLTAQSISGRIALGFGRTGPGLKPKTLVTNPDGTYTYGDLAVRIVEHNYAEITLDREAPYYRDVAKTATEIILTDTPPAASGKLKLPKGTKRFFVVEIYPAWSKPDPTIKRRTVESGLLALDLNAGRTTLFFNPTTAPLPAPASPGTWLSTSSSAPAPTLPPAGHAIVTRP